LTFREFKLSLKNNDVSGSKIQLLARNVLLFGNDALNADQLATLWMIIAVKMNDILDVIVYWLSNFIFTFVLEVWNRVVPTNGLPVLPELHGDFGSEDAGRNPLGFGNRFL
jgi:hypothetical protein